jgi:hypothetical protein
MRDGSGGSGSYAAKYTEDGSLAGHTVYTPRARPPEAGRLPVIVWGNGACVAVGTMVYNFLNELASHRFLVITNGRPNGGGAKQSSYRDLINDPLVKIDDPFQ